MARASHASRVRRHARRTPSAPAPTPAPAAVAVAWTAPAAITSAAASSAALGHPPGSTSGASAPRREAARAEPDPRHAARLAATSDRGESAAATLDDAAERASIGEAGREGDASTRPPDPVQLSAADIAQWRDVLINLARVGSHSYFMLCHLPKSDKGTARKITISHQIGPVQQLNNRLRWVRALFGLNIREHLFYLTKATETVSYHFAVEAPEGMYVYRYKFSHQDLPTSANPAAPTSRRRPRLPDRVVSMNQTHLHVYLRDAINESRDGTQALTLGVSLRERPPGLMESGLLLSLYLAVTVWTVGAFHGTVFSGDGPPPGTWPTVLFGIPTLLSGWLVSRLSAATLQRMSLLSLVM